MFIEFHRNMLGDHVRNQAFYAALKAVIKPGMTVADVGAGTGLLGFMARQLGAGEVYLIDHGPVLQLAEQLARDNNVDGLVFLQEHSTAVIDLPPVDVVISETLGNYAYEEHLIENLNDARRFLKPGGVIIPGQLKQYVAPVTSDRYHNELCVWSKVGYGLDFSKAQAMSLNSLYVRGFTPADLLAQPTAIQCWDEVFFNTGENNVSIRRHTVRWTLDSAQVIYGFAVWWHSELAPGVELTTAPHAPATHWEQLYFPVLRPLHLPAGGQLELTLHSDSRYQVGSHLYWQTSAYSAGGELLDSFEQDIDRGTLADT